MSGLLARFKSRGQKLADSEPAMSAGAEDWSDDDMAPSEAGVESNGAVGAPVSDIVEGASAHAGAGQEDLTDFVLSPIEISLLKGEIIEELRTVYDPEIPVNIYELGLIYDIDVTPQGAVDIKMTLTSPGCPVAGTLPPEVQDKAAAVPGVTDAKVEVIWDPPWNMDMMSDEAKLELGLY